MKPKVMVIGLDGATFKLLKPWAEQGILPNLAELLKRGCSGNLTSTVPPYTPTAWSSFYTGVNPGKHGVFSFTRFNPETGQRELASSRVIGAPKFWQVLNQHGLRTGLINLPLTYPPDKVDGFMVTGMMTPDKSKNYTYPGSLVEELASLEHPYVVDVPVIPFIDASSTAVVDKLRAAIRGRLAATLYLMEKHHCDLMMTVFVAPDRIQHVYWKYLDEDSSLFHAPEAARFREEIMTCYRELDAALGQIIDAAGSECQIYLISDHGFCELRSEFFLNNWLAREGFFSLGSSSRFMLGPGYRWLRSNKLTKFLTSAKGGRLREKGLKRVVDWEHTSAYAREQGLFINLKGREEQGSVAPGEEYLDVRGRIAGKLKEFKDPVTGKNMVNSLSFKEDIYSGDWLEMAPDVIPVFDDYRCYIHDGVLRGKLLEDRTSEPYGAHDPDGIFLACGPDINTDATVDGAQITDVTPTILHALGLPVPENMDGKVIESIFSSAFLTRHPIKRTAADEGGSDEEAVYSQEEAEEIQEQLRGMGYLS